MQFDDTLLKLKSVWISGSEKQRWMICRHEMGEHNAQQPSRLQSTHWVLTISWCDMDLVESFTKGIVLHTASLEKIQIEIIFLLKAYFSITKSQWKHSYVEYSVYPVWYSLPSPVSEDHVIFCKHFQKSHIPIPLFPPSSIWIISKCFWGWSSGFQMSARLLFSNLILQIQNITLIQSQTSCPKTTFLMEKPIPNVVTIKYLNLRNDKSKMHQVKQLSNLCAQRSLIQRQFVLEREMWHAEKYTDVSWIYYSLFLFTFLPRTNNCIIIYHLRYALIEKLVEQYKVYLGNYVIYTYVSSFPLHIIDGFLTFRWTQPSNRNKLLWFLACFVSFLVIWGCFIDSLPFKYMTYFEYIPHCLTTTGY